MIHRSQPALDRAKVANEAVAASGVHVVSCTAADLIRIEPALAPVSETLSGGFYYPNDQHGDPHLFCKGLADRLAAEGVDLRFGETAGTIETSGSRATGVVTDKGRHPAYAVVLAAGFWSAEIGKQLGLRLPIKPVKGYSITYDVDGCDGLPKIPVVDDEMHIGLTPLGKRMRIVGTAEFSGYSPEVNPARIDNLRRVAQATYPALSRVLIENEPLSMWCGHRPMTPDCLPIFGKRGLENLFLNTGPGYLGWTTACGTSRAVSDLIVGRNPSEEVTGLGADRF